MAAVLRSSFGKAIIRRAFSTEETFLVRHSQLRRRPLHTGGTADSSTRVPDASHAVPSSSSLKSPQIDPIAKKINVIARKAALVEYIQRTLQEGKLNVVLPLLVSVFLFGQGYWIGFCDVVDAEYQE